MRNDVKNAIVKLSLDTYRNELPNAYSQRQADEVLRKAWKEATGLDADKPMDYATFRRNKIAIFEILEETLTMLVNEGLTNQFDGFADVRNMAWGDQPSFIIDSPDLFQVATISQSNGNLRRQRLDVDKVTITPVPRGVKIYEDFYRFLVGRISWINMVDKVRRSIVHSVANDVYDAIYQSFSTISTNFKGNATGLDQAGARDNFDKLIDRVEAAANARAVIYGTRASLSKVTPAQLSPDMMNEQNDLGFIGRYKGAELREIRQSLKPGTQQFAIADDFVLIVPQVGGEKIVKVVNEGTAIIQEVATPQHADMSMEFLFTMNVGIGVLAPFYYGIFKWA